MKAAIAALGLVALGALAGGGGVVWAQSPSQINACAERTTGYLKLGSCAGTPLMWNVQGPKGDAGPQGPVGPQGPAGPPGVAPVLQQVVVYKNSAIDKKKHHSVSVMCPGGATALYGGAGLVTPGKPDAAALRIAYSRPAAVGGVPRGWSAGAIKVDFDARLAWTLAYLAVAIRNGFSLQGLYGHSDGPPSFYEDEAEQLSKAQPARWAQAIAGAKEAAVPPAPTIWGVQAWVVCGSAS